MKEAKRESLVVVVGYRLEDEAIRLLFPAAGDR
jgi:hypothetical protein